VPTLAHGSFTVTVRDTTPPSLTLPANIRPKPTSAAGAAVTYVVTATDMLRQRGAEFNTLFRETFALGHHHCERHRHRRPWQQGHGSFTVTGAGHDSAAIRVQPTLLPKPPAPREPW